MNRPPAHFRSPPRPFGTLLGLLCLAAVLSSLKWPALVGYMNQRYHLLLPDLEIPWEIQIPWQISPINNPLPGILNTLDGQVISALNQNFFSSAAAAVSSPHTVNAPGITGENTGLPPGQPRKSLVLSQQDKVLFCGDSLMQGVVPFLSLRFKHQKIPTRDLSRQSTGLAYPKFYDWPKAVREEVESGNVSVLVIFIGANDAWDIIDRGKAIRFGSEAWHLLYKQRVESIVEMAEQKGIRVIWLGLPPMADKRLTDGAPVLNQVFQEVAETHPGMLLIPTEAILSEDGSSFTKYKKNANGEIQRLRADDGIHFAPTGQRLLSELIWSYLEIR